MIDTSSERERADAPLLELRDLHVQFGPHSVLRDINLRVYRGQSIAIIGESGCGKTVLLKTIIGLVKPTRGNMLFDGRDLALLNSIELADLRTRFGFVFQNAALFDSMTIGQNVAFPIRQHRRCSDQEVEQIVMARLAEVGLPDSVVTQKPAELSGGMRKRVGLARASVLKPEVMLYDEPTTGLDPIVADVINELMMRARHGYSVTSVIVTHDMRTARKVADRVVMVYPVTRLQPGEEQIIFDGPPSELDRTEDRRVRQFVRGEAGERLMEMRAAARQAAEARAASGAES